MSGRILRALPSPVPARAPAVEAKRSLAVQRAVARAEGNLAELSDQREDDAAWRRDGMAKDMLRALRLVAHGRTLGEQTYGVALACEIVDRVDAMEGKK